MELPPETVYFDARRAHRSLLKNIKVILLLILLNFPGNCVSATQFPENEAHRLIVIGVQFIDLSTSTDLKSLKNRFFIEMNEYYQEVSFNKVRINGDIINNWVNIPNNMSYYGNYTNNNHTLGARKLLEDVISLIDNTTDFSNYDSIMLVHPGVDEVSSHNEKDIRSWGWWDGLRLATQDGVTFQQGAVVSEKSPLGIFCHEFGHILGLPDLYNDNESEPIEYVGQWGLMGKGCWNNNGTHPSHPTAWSKMKLDWIEQSQIMIVTDRDSIMRIEPLEESTTGIQIVKIPIIAPDIYYLTEIRRHILFDEYLSSEGVLVTLVNESLKSGHGIVRVMNAVNRSTSLNYAAFSLEPNGNSVFLDKKNNLSIIALREENASYLLHISNYLNGKIASEAIRAIHLAELQIEALRNSSFIFLFFKISSIDMSLAVKALHDAKRNYESQNYVNALTKANQATIQALTSEIRLRYKEINFYTWYQNILLIMIAILVILYRRKR